MAQVKTASDIAEAKYDTSKHTIVFVFDQSSCHRKFDKKALLVIADGTAKGLRSILAERGINTTRMKADDTRVVLSNHDDYINDKTSVPWNMMLKVVAIIALFLPKFHCELIKPHRTGLGSF